MPLFGALTVTEARRLIRDNQRLTSENASLSRDVDGLARELEAARAELKRAQEAPAPELADVLAALVARVPTLPYAPGYVLAKGARDADTFAQALHSMLLHARAVGQREGGAQ